MNFYLQLGTYCCMQSMEKCVLPFIFIQKYKEKKQFKPKTNNGRDLFVHQEALFC